MKYGYIRKDYPEETVVQIERVLTYGCDKLFIEENEFHKEEELRKLIEKLNFDDTVMVSDLRVFGKKLRELQDVMREFYHKNIRFVSMEENLDTEEVPSFYQSVFMMAQMDYLHTVYQTREGIKRARELGVIGGRPQINDEVIEKIQTLHKKKMSLRKIATACDVSLGTVHKYVHSS